MDNHFHSKEVTIMKKLLVVSCAFLFVVGFTGAAHAYELTFDDIASDAKGTISSYGGFEWQNFGYQRAPDYTLANLLGAADGEYVAYNISTSGASSITLSDGVFDFVGATLVSRLATGLEVGVTGRLDGVEVYNTSVTLSTTPASVQFDFAGIDELIFDPISADEYFGMDNFTYNIPEALTLQTVQSQVVVATPEPSTLVLLGVGLLGFLGIARKRQRRSRK
ncbi:PEP-CTERM sorting domain-containing protein [candidate division KSB3 bacterium]|uniref:PEP-CTERM sorting domain-containing protein n=1 Tax=candidate division KSB3 bacterium TaxID=2044937 RepID=A0A9D5Q5V8_9BACT|nr:PEP-CTERM sorting domain-containing protein [candidate division KSB3 bacterium]MBD3325229.1 PEP-CTERM sorting domain-containing protein [candidate division KSB3 bacterium]